MNLFVDLEREASSSLIESLSNPRVVSPKTFFFLDGYPIKLRFLENESWVGDPSATIKLKIGTFPTTYLINNVVGVWDGLQYVFDVDFNTQEFDSAIIGKLELDGFLEIQVEEGSHSKTILQVKSKFRNTFSGGVQVQLIEPIEPSLIDLVLITKPVAPEVPVLNITPTAPSGVELGKKPTAPRNVLSGNLSIEPNAPTFQGSQILQFPPARPSLVASTFFGFPNAPTIQLVGVVLPRPFAPTQVVPSLVVQPLLGEVQAFEVIGHRMHKHHHRFLYLSHEGRFEQRFNGSPLVSSDVPFVFSHIDSQGFPTYYRQSDVVLRDFFNNTNIEQEVLRLVLYKSPTFQIWSKNKPLAVYPYARALSYGTGGANRVNLSSIGLPDHWQPKNIPFDLGDGVDSALYALEGVIGYDYGVDTSTAQMPDTIAFRYFANNIKKPENQIGRLGTKDYGGKLISYFESQNDLGDIWNKGAINVEHYESSNFGKETPSSNFKITLNPAQNPLMALPPSLASDVEAIQIVDVNQLPSNVEADLLDFQPLRYSPTLWMDASQEDETKTDFGKLTNFAQSSSEILYYQGYKTSFSSVTQNEKKLFDFSSTTQSYQIPNNAFGRHQTNTGGEFELFFAFRPLSFNPATETHVNGLILPATSGAYRPHAFVNQGGQHAFTAHLPWDQDQLIFDAGRSSPARVSGGLSSLPVDQFHILTLVASATRGKVQAFVNGTFIAENNYSEPITMTKLLLGGWGTKDYGQSMLIGELICFKNVLGLDRQQKVEGYLAHKWGVSQKLDSAHPFRFKNPINFGEFVELERFPRPPVNPLFEVYPNAPTTPLVGFPPDANPSDVETLSFVNPPSQIETRDIPPLRFFENEVEVSAINLNGIVTEAPQFQEVINERVSALIAKDTLNNQQAVSWSVQNTSSTDIVPTITGASSPQPSSFSLNLEDHKPFLASNEVANLNFEVKIEDSNGEQNILPVNMILKGIEQNKFVSQIEDVNIGGELISQDESFDVENVSDFSSGFRWYIPHNTQLTQTFKITLTSPSKIEPKLFLRYWGQQYDGALQYQARNAGRATWFYSETEVTLNNPITPIVQRFGQKLGFIAGRGYGWFEGWRDPNFLHSAPLIVTCTNINEIIPNVSREYTIEIQLTEPLDGLDDGRNKFHWLGYVKRWQSLNRIGVSVDAMKENRNYLTNFSFTANTAEIVQKEAEGVDWFNNQYNNQFNRYTRRVNVTPHIVPDSYSNGKPTRVRSRIGSPVWAYPSKIEVVPQRPKFPCESNFSMGFERTFLYKGQRTYNNTTSSWDLKSGTFHYVDPLNNVLGWSNSMFQAPNFSITEGQGKTWQWGLNLKRFEDGSRISPTFIHHSKLSNIRISSVGYKEQNPWNYFLKPNLVGGFLDLKTQQALEPQEEYLVTFPSGRTQITQFGGYVQTSGNVTIEFFNSDNKQTPVWKYTIHPSNLNHKPISMLAFKNTTDWAWKDNSAKFERDIPLIVLPITTNMRYQGFNRYGGMAMLNNYVSASLNPMQNRFLNADLSEDTRWSDSRYGHLRLKFDEAFTEKDFFNFFVPNQTQEFTFGNNYGNGIIHNGIEYGLYNVGQNKTFNATNTPICKVTFDAFDRVDKSVHPLWGSKLVQWSYNDVPDLPRQFDVTSETEGTTRWSFARWQEYREQTPKPPSVQSIKAVLTFDDLVPSAISLNEFVYDVATIDKPTYIVFNLTNSEVETGQVWRVENMVQGGSYDAEKERNFKLNLVREDLDGVYRLQIGFQDSANFSSKFYNINPLGYVANEKKPRFAVLKNNPDQIKQVIAGGFLKWWDKASAYVQEEPTFWLEAKENWVQARVDTPLFIAGGTGYVRTKIAGQISTQTWTGQALYKETLSAGSYFKIVQMHNAFYSNIRVKSYDWTWNDYYYAPPWNGIIITNKRDTKAHWIVLQKLDDYKARNNKTFYARVESRDLSQSIVTGVVFNEVIQPPTAPTFVETKALLQPDDLSVVETTLSTTREIISVNQLMDDPSDFSTIESDHFIQMRSDSPRFANAILRPVAVIDCLINSGLDQYLRDSNGNIRYQVNQADGTYVPMENPDYTPYYTIKGLSCVMNGTFEQPQLNVIIKPDTINGGLTFGQSTTGSNLSTFETNLRVLSAPNFVPTYTSKYYRHWKNRIYQNFIQPYNTATQLVGKYLVLARDYGTGLKQGDVVKVHSVNYVQPALGVTGHKDIFYIKQGVPHPLTIPKIDMFTNEAWGIFADWGFDLVEE